MVGSPCFYGWYRWGYGWPCGSQYQLLTNEETRQANNLLDEYLSIENLACNH